MTPPVKPLGQHIDVSGAPEDTAALSGTASGTAAHTGAHLARHVHA